MPALALVVLLASCTVHYHFHPPAAPESPRPSAPIPAATDVPTGYALHRTVSGVVIDSEGQPTRARIATVAEGGSYSTSTDDRGRFTIQTPSAHYVLNASTDGGMIALERGQVGSEPVELTLQAGGTLIIDLAGPEKTRCAVFAQHLRAEDFTLYGGHPVRVPVPAGGVRVRLYEGHHVFAEQDFDVRVGESTSASFKLGS